MVSTSNIASILDRDERKRYGVIRKKWTIKSWSLCIGMLVPWAFLLFGFFLFWVVKENVLISVLLFFLGMPYLSFWKRAYTAYFHEAAHYNLNKSKKINDFLATVLLTPFIGLWIGDYRVHHWEHHKNFGTSADTETSYAKPMSVKNILHSLIGLYLVKTVIRYLRVAKTNIQREFNVVASLKFFAGIGFMLIAQGLMSLLMLNFISPYLAVAWLMSMLITDPFFEKVRQTLEHRNGDIKYNKISTVSEGLAINHIFGDDFFSRYFGGAGFNRHLLHHLDPSVSSTCFNELETFLLESSCADNIKACRTTYWQKFKELFSWQT